MNNFSLKQKSVSITLKLVTIISALSGTFLSAADGCPVVNLIIRTAKCADHMKKEKII